MCLSPIDIDLCIQKMKNIKAIGKINFYLVELLDIWQHALKLFQGGWHKFSL